MPIAPDSRSAGSVWRFDVVAGLTAAAVVLPKAMAYAAVAGLPVAVGLYTAFIPMIVYALLGTSRVLSVSSTTTLAILAGTELALVVPDGDPARLVTATATLTALVGVMLVVARLMRLGFVADFISAPVLTGFKAGIGLVIVLDQVPKLLGTHITKQGFFPDLLSVAQHLPETSLLTLAVAVATLVILVAMERLWPHSPAPLAAVGVGIAAAWLLGLEALGVSIVGHIPQGLAVDHVARPRARRAAAAGGGRDRADELHRDDRSGARVRRSRRSAGRCQPRAGRGRCEQSRGSAVGAMPSGGGTSQTAVVRAAGGRTQKASLVTAGAALATMLFLAPLLGLLPNATLAMIVIVYSIGLIQPAEFIAIRKVRTMEFRWAVAAALGVLLFGTLQGILVAIIVSLISLSNQATRPMVHVIGRKRGADVLRPLSPEHPDDETFEGLLILRPEGRLFFANVQNVADQVKALTLEHQPRVLALDFSRVPDIEYSALQTLIESEKRATEQGVVFWLAGLNPGVLEVVRRAGFDEQLGRERLMFNARMVIERYQALRAAEDQAAAGAA